MTLRTITFDDSTHKIVPLEPTFEMIEDAYDIPETFLLSDGKKLIRSALQAYKAMIAAAPEHQEPDSQVAKNAERYEKLRKVNVQEFAEIFRMNIQEGIPFDEIIDGLYIFTAEDIAEAEKEGEKMWHALCGDSTQDIGKDE